MTTVLSGVELYGGSKLLGIPFFPEFKKLMDQDLYLKILLRDRQLNIADGMYKKSDNDGNERKDAKMADGPSRKGIPLHRSPAVFAALCAIGNDAESSKMKTETLNAVSKNSGDLSKNGECSRSAITVTTAKIHDHARRRAAPYPAHNTSPSTKRRKVAPNPTLALGQEVTTTPSWHEFLNRSEAECSTSTNSMSKSFSSPKELDRAHADDRNKVDIQGNKLQSYAIQLLAKQATIDRSIDSLHKSTNASELAQQHKAPAAGNLSNDDASRDRSSRCGSFRNLYSPNASLTKRDISLQRHISNSLSTHGVCVIDGFLGEELCSEISSEVKSLHSSGDCMKGELLGGKRGGEAVRGDLISWVDGTEPGCRNLGTFCRKLDAIIASGAGVTSDYNICGGTKAMAARYPGNGTRYQLHVDNPAKDGRCLTCIYYLNKNWNSTSMGGTLRLHAQMSGKTANIAPVFDRIAIFYSDSRNPHEVLRTHADRYAVTVWYFDRDERMKAIERMDAIRSTEPSST